MYEWMNEKHGRMKKEERLDERGGGGRGHAPTATSCGRDAGRACRLRRLSHAVARYILRSFFPPYFLVSTRPPAHRLRKSKRRQRQVLLPFAPCASRSSRSTAASFPSCERRAARDSSLSPLADWKRK